MSMKKNSFFLQILSRSIISDHRLKYGDGGDLEQDILTGKSMEAMAPSRHDYKILTRTLNLERLSHIHLLNSISLSMITHTNNSGTSSCYITLTLRQKLHRPPPPQKKKKE